MENQQYFDLIRKESQKIGVELTEEAINQFETYLLELNKWNQKINLTGHKEDKYIIANLFIDSLAFHKAVKCELPCSVLDIGSGAGFPGLPLKISESKLSVTLVEPNLKKVSFLHHIIGTLHLNSVVVEAKRIEEMPSFSHFLKSYDWIFLKALRFDVCLPYVRHLLGEGGRVVVSRPKKIEGSLGIEGFTIQQEIPYTLPFGCGERELIVLSPTVT